MPEQNKPEDNSSEQETFSLEQKNGCLHCFLCNHHLICCDYTFTMSADNIPKNLMEFAFFCPSCADRVDKMKQDITAKLKNAKLNPKPFDEKKWEAFLREQNIGFFDRIYGWLDFKFKKSKPPKDNSRELWTF